MAEKIGSGTLRRVVDFDTLRDLLGEVAEGQRERYQFTWPGKAEARADARRLHARRCHAGQLRGALSHLQPRDHPAGVLA